MSNLTPVEALQREIELVRASQECLAEISSDLADNTRTLHVRIAALELAKADAELQDHLQSEPTKYYGDELVSDDWYDWQDRMMNMRNRVLPTIRTKLYEALQK